MGIKVVDVGFKYNENYIFKKLNLNFKNKEISAIMGPSGCGKTTLIELISGLMEPNEGYILNDRQVGIIMESPEEQFFNLTVYQEIEFALLSYIPNKEERRKMVNEVLELVKLDLSIFDRDPNTLSSGEKRRVAIASILVFKPEIIIFDEPSLGLDSNGRRLLIRLINDLKNEYKKTVIIATNDYEFVHKVADYIYVLGNKGVVLEGNKYDVFTNKKIFDYGIGVPKVIDFSQRVLENKKVKMGFRDDLDDLLKDIYRYVK